MKECLRRLPQNPKNAIKKSLFLFRVLFLSIEVDVDEDYQKEQREMKQNFW